MSFHPFRRNFSAQARKRAALDTAVTARLEKLLKVAREQHKNNRWEPLGTTAQEAIDLGASSAEFYLYLAKSKVMAGDWQEALAAAALHASASTKLSPFRRTALRLSVAMRSMLPGNFTTRILYYIGSRTDLPPVWWWGLSHWCFRTGYMQWAHKARNKSARVHLKDHTRPNRERVQALIQLGKYSEAVKNATKITIDADAPREPLISAITRIASLDFSNSHPALPACDWIRGKTIAVVGPAATQHEMGEEIDSHDVVIRTSFRAPTPASIARYVGAKTTASYYNLADEAENRAQISAMLHQKVLKAAVFRTAEPISAPEYYGLTVREVARVPFFWMSDFGLLGIPRILFDVCQYSPKSVKVFNTDFYTGKTAYHTAYPEREANQIKSLARHGLIENFVLAKRMYTAGLFSADPRLTKILDADTASYIAMLEASGLGSAHR